jgi:spore coat polysaccharide biosynthesis predicted glycosyltransferase SpsG
MGHISTSLALAQGLGRKGVSSLFVVRDHGGKVLELIQRQEHVVETLPGSLSFDQELPLTVELVKQYSPEIVITDLCNLDALAQPRSYERYLWGLRESSRFLIIIDYLSEIVFPSHIVVNPYYGPYGIESLHYSQEGGTRYLLGPQYVLLREEFTMAAQQPREIRETARNILVTLGGGDPLKLNLKVARALNQVKIADLNLRFVLGFDYPDEDRLELERALRNFPGRWELILGSDNMAAQMLWCDLAITAGGLTRYETAVTGTPSLILCQAEHQVELVRRFEKAGTTINLGWGREVTEGEIAAAVENLAQDALLRQEMSRRGKELVDGKGVERLISEIPDKVWQGRLCPGVK